MQNDDCQIRKPATSKRVLSVIEVILAVFEALALATLMIYSSVQGFFILIILLIVLLICASVLASVFAREKTRFLRDLLIAGASTGAICLICILCMSGCARGQGAEEETFSRLTPVEMIAACLKMPEDASETVTEATKAVIAYRFDCESCSRYIDDLKTLQQRLETDGLGDVPFVCTRSEHGREIVAASNIREVPCVLVSNGDGTWTAVGVTTEEPSDVFANMTTIVFDVDSVAASVEAMAAG